MSNSKSGFEVTENNQPKFTSRNQMVKLQDQGYWFQIKSSFGWSSLKSFQFDSPIEHYRLTPNQFIPFSILYEIFEDEEDNTKNLNKTLINYLINLTTENERSRLMLVLAKNKEHELLEFMLKQLIKSCTK